MPERIRVQAIDGTWETLGVDRYQGAVPAGIAATWNQKGPDTLTFTLPRRRGVRHPDLDPFTPIEYMPDGRDAPSWTGYTLEAPGGSEGISVQARGLQYHADDDAFRALWVHDDLGAWVDIRQRLEADLSRVGTAAGIVNIAEGALTIGWPKGTALGGAAPYSGVILDCGDDPAGWPIAVTLEYLKNTFVGTDWSIRVRSSASPNIAVDAFDAEDVVIQLGTAANGAYSVDGTFAKARRYVGVFAFYHGGGVTNGEDDTYKLTAIRLYAKAGYRNAILGESALRTNDVVLDAFARCPLLDTANADIDNTVLTLRHVTAADETPMAIAERMNAYHGWRLKIDHRRRAIFKPQLDRATLSVDLAQPGADFEDASLHSGADIYNKVIVRGRDGYGSDLRVIRYSAGLFPARVQQLSSPAPANPGAEVDAANWTNVNRVLTNPRSGVGAFGFATLTSPPEAVGNMAGADFMPGVTYRFDLWVRATMSASARAARILSYFYMRAGVPGTDETTVTFDAYKLGIPTNVYTQLSVFWTPRTRTPAANVKVGFRGERWSEPQHTPSAFGSLQFDDVAVVRSTATLPDRRGFLRAFILDIPQATDAAAMQALGDAWLRLHAYTPLRGTLTVTSDKAVTLINGDPVPRGELGIYTGELILLRNLTDPDLGDFGRVGIIATASKGPNAGTLTLDNERANFQALLNRMGVVGRPA